MEPTDHAARLLASHDYIDKHYDLDSLYSPFGASAVRRLAARASHHPHPFGVALQVGLLGATNGAGVRVWPGSISPLSAIALNVNLVQTRKSQVSSVMQKISDIVQEASRRRGAEVSGVDDLRKLKMKSCTLTSFTEAALWERCSSDWQQCATGQLSGRVHFSTILNLDESYKFLRYLGLSANAKGGDLQVGVAHCFVIGLCDFAVF